MRRRLRADLTIKAKKCHEIDANFIEISINGGIVWQKSLGFFASEREAFRGAGEGRRTR
jgi:hypothetical protein